MLMRPLQQKEHMIEIALYNGKEEARAPWYKRAYIPRDIGYWNVDGDLICTKIEIAFPKVDLKTGIALDVTGWALLVPHTDVPLFVGPMPPMRIDVNVTFCIKPQLTTQNLTIDEKFVTYWALFNTPRLDSHERTLIKMLEGVEVMLATAKTVDQVDAEDRNITIN